MHVVARDDDTNWSTIYTNNWCNWIMGHYWILSLDRDDRLQDFVRFSYHLYQCLATANVYLNYKLISVYSEVDKTYSRIASYWTCMLFRVHKSQTRQNWLPGPLGTLSRNIPKDNILIILHMYCSTEEYRVYIKHIATIMRLWHLKRQHLSRGLSLRSTSVIPRHNRFA